MICTKNEFKRLIPKLQKEEYKLLERSLIDEGCRDSIITWHDIIIDGHNRYEICRKYNIPFKTSPMNFENEEEAKAWMLKNQMGRRNLTDKQRSDLIGRIYKQEKIVAEFKGNVHCGQNVHNGKTSERIAQQYGINEKTVRRNEKFADAIDNLKNNIEPETVNKILTDEIPITKTEAVKLAREKPEIQKKIVPLFESGQTKKVEDRLYLVENQVSIADIIATN